jgi:hypothetical protein
MSVQEDKAAGQEEGQQLAEKPEPDEDDKKKAAEMMESYQDRPTLVLPGTGGMVSGTAVNDWLDEDGNPKGAGDQDEDTDVNKEQIEKDKAWNEELRKVAQEHRGENG